MRYIGGSIPKKAVQKLVDIVVERGAAPSVDRARAIIMAGLVRVNGEVVTKSGTSVSQEDSIDITYQGGYVGRGAFKLKGAIEAFSVAVSGRVCADVGSSTGGFTEILLENGALRVYAIDVGYGELAWKLRKDERVVVMERTNARYLDILPEPVSLAVIDVSFISLKLILPQVMKWLAPGESQPQSEIIALIKPQFEAPQEKVEEGGVIRNSDTHREVLSEVLGWCKNNEFSPVGLIKSPVKGMSGNVEFLALLKPGTPSEFDIEKRIQLALMMDVGSGQQSA